MTEYTFNVNVNICHWNRRYLTEKIRKSKTLIMYLYEIVL